MTKPYLTLVAREASKANLFCVIKDFLRWVKSSHSKGSSQCSLLQNSRAENLKYSKLQVKCMLVTLVTKKKKKVSLLSLILEFIPRCTIGFQCQEN